ncbi:MAG: class I SAM-dependent methyltransferase [Lachnospiraceae bacterium]|nr:class I SAM-dependent methyltransferase [Lachnospiraceae bacterium]
MRILSSENKNIWDKFAPVYTNFVTGTPGNKKAYKTIYGRIKAVIKEKEVLEIATGPGIIARQVACEAKKMTATDYSEKMLAMARRDIVPDNLNFEQADATDLPYEDNSFDVIIIANALHVIPNPEKVLDEIRRVLKKDGLLIAPNFVHDNKKKISNMLGKALSVAGVDFKAKWSAKGYTDFLKRNGFNVRFWDRLPSTIPMVYAECTVAENLIEMKGE